MQFMSGSRHMHAMICFQTLIVSSHTLTRRSQDYIYGIRSVSSMKRHFRVKTLERKNI